MNALPIEDMSNTFIEHSFVINNFVVMVGKQIKDSLCRVLGDGVPEYWIVDWRKKQVEIYLNDGREDGTTHFFV